MKMTAESQDVRGSFASQAAGPSPMRSRPTAENPGSIPDGLRQRVRNHVTKSPEETGRARPPAWMRFLAPELRAAVLAVLRRGESARTPVVPERPWDGQHELDVMPSVESKSPAAGLEAR